MLKNQLVSQPCRFSDKVLNHCARSQTLLLPIRSGIWFLFQLVHPFATELSRILALHDQLFLAQVYPKSDRKTQSTLTFKRCRSLSNINYLICTESTLQKLFWQHTVNVNFPWTTPVRTWMRVLDAQQGILWTSVCRLKTENMWNRFNCKTGNIWFPWAPRDHWM